jgi:hypothetical protein
MGSYAGGKCIAKTLALLLALMAAIAFIPTPGNAQKAAKKLSKQDVIDLLTGDVSSDDVAQEARKSGISFQLTAAVEKEIHDAGGTDDLIRVLRTLAPHAPAPPAAPTHSTTPAASPPVLMIESSPGQSEVYVDDEPVGTTSQQGRLKLTRLAEGDHRVRVSLSGYQDHEETVTLKAGEATTVAATLQRPAAPPVNSPPLRPQTEETPAVNPNPGQAGYLGVFPMQQQPAGARGVVLASAQPGGPADQAGLKAYDTILTVNGQPVTTPLQLRNTLSSHQVGEVVEITWYNGSTNVTRQIRLAAAPAPGQAAVQPSTPPTLTNMPHNGLVSFRAAHDHGRNGQDYCVGVMSIGNGMIYYKADNGIHNFEIPLNTVREARRNTVYLVGYGAFHIRTNKGSNFNFAALNEQGQIQPPDAILTAIDNAMGK